MSKRIAAIICVIVALGSFLGGVIYGAREFLPVIERQQTEYDALSAQFYAFYTVPLDISQAYRWFDWATEQYQYYMDNTTIMNQETLESYQTGIETFNLIKELLLEYEAEIVKGGLE